MNYEETVNFIKLFLLLMNGGTFLLRTLIYKLILESGKSLDDLLLQSRDLFEKELKKNKKQFDLLFPGSSQNADIEQWDISLLTFVLLNVFKGFFNSSEITAIQVIRDQRNKILAHNAKSELTLKDFMSAWNQISGALTDLSTSVTPEDQKELKSIESSIFQDPFQKDIDEKLKEMGQTDTLVHAVVENVMPLVKAKLSDSEKKTQMKFENLFQRMRNIEEDLAKQGKLQREHGNQIAVLAKMRVKTGSIRGRRQAQTLILEASNKIISKDPGEDSSDDELLSTVGDLFSGVEEQGVKVVKADEGSILLTILCPTVKSLRDVTYYLRGPQIQPKLSQIEEVVGKCCSCAVNITIDVDLDSLESATVKLEKEIHTGTVYLALECSGAAGVEEAFQFFENCETLNKFNKISEALSRKVGEKVELVTEIDTDKLEDDIKRMESELIKEEPEQTFLLEVTLDEMRIIKTAVENNHNITTGDINVYADTGDYVCTLNECLGLASANFQFERSDSEKDDNREEHKNQTEERQIRLEKQILKQEVISMQPKKKKRSFKQTVNIIKENYFIKQEEEKLIEQDRRNKEENRRQEKEKRRLEEERLQLNEDKKRLEKDMKWYYHERHRFTEYSNVMMQGLKQEKRLQDAERQLLINERKMQDEERQILIKERKHHHEDIKGPELETKRLDYERKRLVDKRSFQMKTTYTGKTS